MIRFLPAFAHGQVFFAGFGSISLAMEGFLHPSPSGDKSTNHQSGPSPAPGFCRPWAEREQAETAVLLFARDFGFSCSRGQQNKAKGFAYPPFSMQKEGIFSKADSNARRMPHQCFLGLLLPGIRCKVPFRLQGAYRRQSKILNERDGKFQKDRKNRGEALKSTLSSKGTFRLPREKK